MSGSDGMCKIPLIILYITVSLAAFLLDLRLGQSRESNLEVTLEDDENSFKQNLAACLCIDSSLWMFRLVWGSQTQEAYSRIGQTSDL